jgi:malate permease and related proteins
MMHICLSFLVKVLPLYMNIFLGYIAGKMLDVAKDTVAKLMLYVFTPLVIFNGIVNTRLDFSIVSLPAITFVISCCLCYLFYRLSCFIWKDSTKNLVGFSAGTGNTGYFGLPLALLLFDDQGEGIYIMAILGVTLYENSFGFYMIARGKHTRKECLAKLAKLPALYAFFGGLLFNFMQIPFPDVLVDFMKHIKGAYTVLGMMIVGLGIAGLKHFKFDLSFLGMTFLAKFVVWPVLMAGVIALDTYLFGFFNQNIYQALTLLSFVPLAANMVIFASLLDIHPEKAAAAILISTVISIIYLPLMVGCFLL